MQTRHNYQKTARKFARWLKYQKFSKIAIYLSILFTLIMSGIIVYRYKTTQTWVVGALNGRQSEVPPEFARNIYSVSVASDMRRLADVTAAIDQINRDGGVNDRNYDHNKRILNESIRILAKYHVKGGDSFKNQEHLQLYLNIYNFLQTAYSKPNAKKVNELSGQMMTYSLSNDTDTNKKLLGQLKNVADDYNQLSSVSDKALSVLGGYSKNVITVNANLTKDKINNLLDLTNNQTFLKFSNIKHLRKILHSQALADILSINNSNSRKNKWQKTLQIYQTLTKSQYVSVAKIKTLKDLAKYHLKMRQVEVPTGMELSDSSKVTALYYRGQKLDDDQYVKIGANVVGEIEPEFKPVKHDNPHVIEHDQTQHENDNNNQSRQNNQSHQDHQPQTDDKQQEKDHDKKDDADQQSSSSDQDNNDNQEDDEQ